MGVKCSRCGSTDPGHIQNILSPAGMECSRPIPAALTAVRDHPEAGWPEQRHRLGTVIAAFTKWLGVLALAFLVTLIVVTMLLDAMSMFQRRK